RRRHLLAGQPGRELRTARTELPASVASDLDREHVVARRLERAHDAFRRRLRDRVLTRPAAEDHRNAACHWPTLVLWPPPCCNWPTCMITTSPDFASEPGAGSVEMTMPSCAGSVTGS